MTTPQTAQPSGLALTVVVELGIVIAKEKPQVLISFCILLASTMTYVPDTGAIVLASVRVYIHPSMHHSLFMGTCFWPAYWGNCSIIVILSGIQQLYRIDVVVHLIFFFLMTSQ